MKEAVSAIFVYQDELFLVRRQFYLRVFPGFYAFPGGKIDADESEQPFSVPFLSDFPAIHMRTLCREMKEELHFDLEQAVTKGEVLHMDKIGISISPSFEPFSFRVHHFRIVLKHRPAFKVDTSEAVWGMWKTPKELLTFFEQGGGLMTPTAQKMIRAMSRDILTTDFEKFELWYDTEKEIPLIELVKGVRYFPVPSNTLPPAKNTNSFLLGDEDAPNYLVDPSPRSEEEYGKLLHVLKRHKLNGILLTHHHPDHHERAIDLAKELDIPVLLSQNTLDFMIQKYGKEYLRGPSFQFVHDGGLLTHWCGKRVLIYEIPGHDKGQIGIAPETMEWFIVGDLISEQGSVVIAEPEGNMREYFDSLRRVIALEPNIIFPSHGLPMGGIWYLKVALDHRTRREQEILKLYKKGKSPQEILPILYGSIDPSLYPLALQNINQHLNKLHDEGQLELKN